MTSVLQDAEGLQPAIDTMQEKVKYLDFDAVAGWNLLFAVRGSSGSDSPGRLGHLLCRHATEHIGVVQL